MEKQVENQIEKRVGIKKTLERNSILIIFILLLITSASIGVSVSMYKNYVINPVEKKEYDPLSFMGQVSSLQKSYLAYKGTSSLGMLIRWMTLFDKAVYKSGGNPNFHEWDCLSSSYKFWKSFDSNITLESIPRIKRRLDNLNSRVKTVAEIESGDIVIFKPIWRKGREVWHLGVVEKVQGYRIFYMDVNARTRTKGLQVTYLTSKQLSGVYKMSFGFWIGDFFRQMKRK